MFLLVGICSLHVYRKYRAMRNQTRNNVEVREFQTVELDERRAARTTSTVSYAYARNTSGEYDYIRDADVVNTYLELIEEEPYTRADEYIDPHPYRKIDNAEDQSEIKNDIPVNDDFENQMEKNIQSDDMGTQDVVNELESDLDGGNIDPAHRTQNRKETQEESMSSANNDGNIAEHSTSIDGGYIHAVWTEEIDTGKFESTKIDGPLEPEAEKFKGAIDEKTLEGVSPGQDFFSDKDDGQMHPEENQEFAYGTCQEKTVTICGQEFETKENEGKLEEMTVEGIFPSRECK
ncbi:uncharacterized protein LOC123530306 isoform X2 [Mercenaria mercenaria]|uniref:uncharacterized protein LOC123530306 isoform X2 n=1 Tax=Mercenaria mercenaria TaxID=6596 RepID=UPI00234F76B6|nr:uncharacterized protein LOC123530306 isoform X2 [Mercenaria mercenaria]